MSPGEVLFSRPLHVKLPQVPKNLDDQEIRDSDAQAKLSQKEYADKRSRARSSSLRCGDYVLLKSPQPSKGLPKFDPKPLEVVQLKGSMATARGENGRMITRNVSHMKKTEQMQDTEERNDAKETNGKEASDSSKDQDVPESRYNLRAQRDRNKPRYLNDYQS